MTNLHNNNKYSLLLISTLLLSFLWGQWANFGDLFGMWMASDEYSSGMLVPLMAFVLLYSRAKKDHLYFETSNTGLAALILSQLINFAGILFMSAFLTRFSVLIGIYSILLLILGNKICLKNYGIIIFLALMVPLPNSVHSILSSKLQIWATQSAVFFLEIAGYNVITEGNIINIGETSVAVAEACNGLRMITAFFVTTGLITLIIHRPKWQKIIAILSTLPIALICNTVRLFITSIAFTMIEGDQWEKLFHDFGGFAMMPLAILLIIAELAFMNMLVEADNKTEDEDNHTFVLKGKDK